MHVEADEDVRDVVQLAVDSAATVTPAAASSTWSSVEPGLRADLDRDQMTQVLVNLVKNGVEAMKAGTAPCASAPTR